MECYTKARVGQGWVSLPGNRSPNQVVLWRKFRVSPSGPNPTKNLEYLDVMPGLGTGGTNYIVEIMYYVRGLYHKGRSIILVGKMYENIFLISKNFLYIFGKKGFQLTFWPEKLQACKKEVYRTPKNSMKKLRHRSHCPGSRLLPFGNQMPQAGTDGRNR